MLGDELPDATEVASRMKKANLAGSQGAVNTWFAANVEPYVNDIVFNHIAVGNEVIPGSLAEHILPVMKYLQNVINDKNLDGIKVTIVLSGTALASSYPPSNGAFKPEASNVMSAILAFLSARGSPLMINVYPYFVYSSDPANIHLNYAQFTATSPVVQDGPLSYYNLFDATKAGGGGVGVVVSESGWPSDGNGDFTTPELARTYNRNFLKHITSKAGTPKRPGAYIEGYIFAMFTENQKPEGVEQHFGLFHPNMQPVYPVLSRKIAEHLDSGKMKLDLRNQRNERKG
ncbi:Glycosyl hydrolase superfamily protein [Prunus dulcis]|uniref:glucan endo-1,3-beta-D-glucosidase n=1 Tax=Prunus dulcis TaxID=3755 RepID=A0A4Y1RV22_PRUDU|nr:Glycosyl hydrolase superfamily protein [Prunus dulcis]